MTRLDNWQYHVIKPHATPPNARHQDSRRRYIVLWWSPNDASREAIYSLLNGKEYL